ncbi:hypothetical protein ACFQ4C_21015 [Larkinella insperata]|uniref:Uncharacterized protein n=1 Tax=Larkinella insperata TaxID=332158 RepID=A0ABW3QBF1_9BACT
MVQLLLGPLFTAHFQKAGFVTVAKANGAEDLEITNETKHRTTTLILHYNRRRNGRKRNASEKLGL